MKKNCLIIAGEKSGEEHCMSFLPSMIKSAPDYHFFGVGGDLMKKIGFEILYHLEEFSSWGYSEVISKIPFYIRALKKIDQEIVSRDTEIAILIDFQEFNLKLAKKLSGRGVKVLYYVAPQAWAWKPWRTRKLKAYVHTLFTIIPFEKKWFMDRGVKRVHSVDHPILRFYENKLKNWNGKKRVGDTLNLLLLPGSRNSEVKYMLPDFIEALKILKKKYKIRSMVVVSPNVRDETYGNYLDEIDLKYKSEDLVDAIKQADICFASSGTVTLTTALFMLPTIVCYKSSLLNYYIYESFVSYRGPASLANIALKSMPFPELLQDSCSSYAIAENAKKWIDCELEYKKIKEELARTKEAIKGKDKSVDETFLQLVN